MPKLKAGDEGARPSSPTSTTTCANAACCRWSRWSSSRSSRCPSCSAAGPRKPNPCPARPRRRRDRRRRSGRAHRGRGRARACATTRSGLPIAVRPTRSSSASTARPQSGNSAPDRNHLDTARHPKARSSGEHGSVTGGPTYRRKRSSITPTRSTSGSRSPAGAARRRAPAREESGRGTGARSGNVQASAIDVEHRPRPSQAGRQSKPKSEPDDGGQAQGPARSPRCRATKAPVVTYMGPRKRRKRTSSCWSPTKSSPSSANARCVAGVQACQLLEVEPNFPGHLRLRRQRRPLQDRSPEDRTGRHRSQLIRPADRPILQ